MYSIEAEIYTTVDKFEYVKVNIDGVYISGIKVMESMKYPGQLWIQMPSYKVKKDWKRYIESAKDSPLGAAMYAAIEEVVWAKLKPGQNAKSKDSEMLEIDEPIDLDNLPF